jgi:hypothetical protein
MTRCGMLVLATCLVAAGCGDDNGTSPSAVPIVFTAHLSPVNEVPPIANAESTGTGAVQITIDPTSRTPTFYYQLTGFPPDTRAIAAHIHSAPAGINGGIVVNTGMSTTTLTSGITEITTQGQPIDAALFQAIVNNPAAYYFNVHSPLNPGGFARGQLVRTQ